MKDKNNSDFVQTDEEDEMINLREVVEKYLYHYKWFILCVVLAVLAANIKLRYTPKLYQVAATILIDDGKNGGLSPELAAFEDLGILGSTQTNIDNEIGVLKSRSLMERVAKDLELNITYYFKGNVRTTELFDTAAPFKINFFVKDSILDQLSMVFNIKKITTTSFVLSDIDGANEVTHNFGESINLGFGNFIVTPRDASKTYLQKEIKVVITPLENVVNRYKGRVKIAANDKKSSLITISMQDGIIEKARKIIDYLIYQYNKDAITDKSSIAKNTDLFINERLAVISKDLMLVDKEVEDFKTDNKLTDISAEAGLILSTNKDIEQKIIELNTQLKLAEYVTAYINNNTKDLIPENLGLADENTNLNTENYNKLLLEYNRILNSSGKLNPILINLEAQILKLRESIKQSLVNLNYSLNISLNEAKRQESNLNSKITAVPKQEREYRDIQRQQQTIETLYLYLLKKREENAISLAVTAPNAKIIDKAYGSRSPVSPKPKIIYLLAISLGTLIPFMVIYLIFLLDNKIHTIEDLEKELDAIVLGDIPKVISNDKYIMPDEGRDPVTESFRMLRTNMSFVLSKIKKNSKTIFVTSTIKGEGKTFTSINLARVLALSGKKVLLIGADVRNPQIAQFLNVPKKEGLTYFLKDENMQADSLIQHMLGLGFDMLQSGSIPPNTSELLMNGRFDKLLDYGRENYDYIVVDTAPVSLVTDTLLLSHNNTDLFVYVVRANFLDKRLLKVPRKLIKTKRIENMAILLNDTIPEKVRGYGYGYNYGYGYGEEVPKKTFWKRLLKTLRFWLQ